MTWRNEEVIFPIMNESERFLIYFVNSISVVNDHDVNSSTHVNSSDFPFLLSSKYLHFLDNHAEWSKDIYERLMIANSISVCRKFLIYCNSIREGDRIIQEKFIMRILEYTRCRGKNYVEIVFNFICKEHGNVSFSELEETRLNSYVRCNSGNI